VLKILLVDDDVSLRATYSDALRMAGLDVSEAGDGAIALAMTERTAFDVIVTDLLMPNMDGIELLMALRGAAVTTPVIVLTGGIGDRFGRRDRLTEPCLAAARLLGAVRTLQKPLPPSALTTEIEALSLRSGAA